MATEPNKKLLSDPRVPRITFDDQDWPIPKLAPAQNEVVLPLLEATLAKIQASGGRIGIGTGMLSKETLRDLGTITFTALTRAHPDLTRDEFDQMPIGLMELVDAMFVVQRQTGLYRAPKPGEVNGTSPLATTNSPTG